jgi:hypothetical protein
MPDEEATAISAQALALLDVTADQARAIDHYLAAVDQLANKPKSRDALLRAARALTDAGVPEWTPLFRRHHIVLETDGPEQRAYAKVPIRKRLDRIAWVVHPKFWRSCIRQVADIEFLDGAVTSGLEWRARMLETVNLTHPVRLGAATLKCELDVKYSCIPGRRALVEYTLVEDRSGILSINEGSILVAPVDQQEQTLSLVTIKKRVVVRSGQSIGELFEYDPHGLESMLAYWIMQAHSECPGAGPHHIA